MEIPRTEIIITENGVELARKTVAPGEYVIGRDLACDVPVTVGLVSRRHAKLTVNYNEWLVEDLGSSNGTLVNGKPLTQATRLWPNQKIQIGSALIELRRVKGGSSTDQSLAPQTAAVRAVLPAEFLHEKKYDIGGVVAQGGMGAILDAREVTIERTVAMKVMLDSSSADALRRFIAEAKITGQLEHPNIVPVHELSVDEQEQVFYTMKFVRGITLRKVLELIRDGAAATAKKYTLTNLLTVFQKVCDAFVRKSAPLPGGGSFWLGGFMDKPGGEWKWVTGEPWSYTHWGKRASGVNEPNGTAAKPENALALANGGFVANPDWSDVAEDSEKSIGFLVEWHE